MQEILEPREKKPGDPADDAARFGRAGHGAESIVPHLSRQQQINDKPASSDEPGPGGSRPGQWRRSCSGYPPPA